MTFKMILKLIRNKYAIPLFFRIPLFSQNTHKKMDTQVCNFPPSTGSRTPLMKNESS